METVACIAALRTRSPCLAAVKVKRKSARKAEPKRAAPVYRICACAPEQGYHSEYVRNLCFCVQSQPLGWSETDNLDVLYSTLFMSVYLVRVQYVICEEMPKCLQYNSVPTCSLSIMRVGYEYLRVSVYISVVLSTSWCHDLCICGIRVFELS